ncbi:ATP-binding cassette domain-containing protein [Fictibacillus iocasae]|uniref:ATP-binding cassette domain-containing protein n=1 Tax=Fictibacillus iocasae TaxID=2715437 RepID=A0ABW2NTL6_9BACL
MLNISGLTIEHKSTPLVKNITLAVGKGEWHAIAGESGSGKSLSSLAIGGLLSETLTVTGGAIHFQGVNLLSVSKSSLRKIRGKEISYIFQDYQGSFTPFLTIGTQFDEMLREHTVLLKKERYSLAVAALEEVGLSGQEVFHRYSFQLSGGQVQRAAIALGMILKPKLIIADEPTTALDSVTAASILTLLKQQQKKTNCSVMFITHDLRLVKKYSNFVTIMQNGEVVEQGKPGDVLTRPKHDYTKHLISAIPPLIPNPPRRLTVEHAAEVR